MAQKPGLGKLLDQYPAGGIDVRRALVQIAERICAQRSPRRQGRVTLLEERPGEIAVIGHGGRGVQLPSNSGRFFSRKARYARRKSSVCMQIA